MVLLLCCSVAKEFVVSMVFVVATELLLCCCVAKAAVVAMVLLLLCYLAMQVVAAIAVL